MRRKNTTTEMMMGYMCSALLELMLEKDYAKISIGEIAKKAGVDRSSYYRHFKSKEDIISFFFDMVLKESLDGFTNLSSIDFTLYIHSIYMAFYNYKKEVLLIYHYNLLCRSLHGFEQCTNVKNHREIYHRWEGNNQF